jgi:UDP:flavonoid glycosyltransferase YjiC (YdhE family)
MLDPNNGFGYWLGISNLTNIESLYNALDKISEDADLLVSTPLVMAAHLVAQRRRLPLISCCMSPAMILRETDGVAKVDPNATEWRLRLAALRSRLGLPRRIFPQMERFCADLTLGIYPKCLGGVGSYVRDPMEVGYPILPDTDGACSAGLANWLSKGPFALFSFGSYIDQDVERCFRSAVSACEDIALRCLYISPYSHANLSASSQSVRVESYIPHNLVMPLSSVIVHHGGTGTLSAAIQARRPMVITPFGLDQFFNAKRLGDQDLAEVLPAAQVDRDTLKFALTEALNRSLDREKLWHVAGQGVGVESADVVAEVIFSQLDS